MGKIILIILGILLIFFGIAQVLQLMGLIGTKTFSMPGIAFAVLGFALGAACFKKVFKNTTE